MPSQPHSQPAPMPTDYERMALEASRKLQDDLQTFLESVTVDRHRMARVNGDELLTLLQTLTRLTTSPEASR